MRTLTFSVLTLTILITVRVKSYSSSRLRSFNSAGPAFGLTAFAAPNVNSLNTPGHSIIPKPMRTNREGQLGLPIAYDHPVLSIDRKTAPGGAQSFHELTMVIPPSDMSLDSFAPQQTRVEKKSLQEMSAYKGTSFHQGLDFYMQMSVKRFAQGDWIKSFPPGWYELIVLNNDENNVRFMKVEPVSGEEIESGLTYWCRPGFTSMLTKREFGKFRSGKLKAKGAVKFKIDNNKIKESSNRAKLFSQQHDPGSWKVFADKLSIPWDTFQNVHDKRTLSMHDPTEPNNKSDVCNSDQSSVPYSVETLAHSPWLIMLEVLAPVVLCLCGVGCLCGALAGYWIQVAYVPNKAIPHVI